MADLNQMNEAYGIAGQVSFVAGRGEMPEVQISNALGEAAIGLQGAHILSYQAKEQQPLIWMSEEARFAPGKSLRGGIPVCWPWFGPHDSDSSLPAHGPARTSMWQPVAAEAMVDGRTRVSFELIQDERLREICGHPLDVQLQVTVGSSLHLQLETTNRGRMPFTLGQALHTYFLVGDVRLAHVDGLDGCTYIDKVDQGQQKQQHGVVTISEETDRIYLETDDSQEIVDPVMGRKIVIQSMGSHSTVVWNPWEATAQKMEDLGPDGYLNMLCVETTNAADDQVQLAPGASHTLVAEYHAELLPE